MNNEIHEVENFDPSDVTSDPVLIKIFDALIAHTTNAVTIARLRLQRIWHISDIKYNERMSNSFDMGELLAALENAENLFAANDTRLTSSAQPDRPDLSVPSQQAALNCIKRENQITRTDKNSKKHACSLMEQMMAAVGYAPIPFIGQRRSMDDLCLCLYAAIHDHHWSELSTSSIVTPVDKIRLEVVTYLALCGGRPAASQPVFIDRSATYDELHSAITDVQANIWLTEPERDGDVPFNTEKDRYYFLTGITIDALDMEAATWQEVKPEYLQAIKSAQFGQRVFIIHAYHKSISTDILAKQAYLRAHSEYTGWSWGLLKTTKEEKEAPVPFVPLAFVPACEKAEGATGGKKEKGQKPLSERQLKRSLAHRDKLRLKRVEQKLKKKGGGGESGAVLRGLVFCSKPQEKEQDGGDAGGGEEEKDKEGDEDKMEG